MSYERRRKVSSKTSISEKGRREAARGQGQRPEGELLLAWHSENSDCTARSVCKLTFLLSRYSTCMFNSVPPQVWERKRKSRGSEGQSLGHQQGLRSIDESGSWKYHWVSYLLPGTLKHSWLPSYKAPHNGRDLASPVGETIKEDKQIPNMEHGERHKT